MAVIRDLRDLLLLVSLSAGLGALRLAADPETSWLAEAPAPVEGSCELPEEAFAELAPLPDSDDPDVPRVEVGEVRDLLARGEITVVDARSPHAYASGHIPGAFSLPLDEARTLLGRSSLPIPTQQMVVTYCDDERTAEDLGRLLGDDVGCREVRVLSGGWSAWVDAGAPIETLGDAESGHG